MATKKQPLSFRNILPKNNIKPSAFQNAFGNFSQSSLKQAQTTPIAPLNGTQSLQPKQQQQAVPVSPTTFQDTYKNLYKDHYTPTPTPTPTIQKPQIRPTTQTTDGQNINVATGGLQNQNVVPPTPPVATPNPLETAVSTAENQYKQSLGLTPQETATQEQLANLSESFKSGYQGISDKAIPMGFITGQQRSLENRALNLAEPLESKLSRLQAKRLAGAEASKFALQRADKAVESAKPGASGGTIGGTAQSVYIEGQDPTVDAYAQEFLSGRMKLENVPTDYRGLVAQAVSGKTIEQAPSEYKVERTDRAISSVAGLLKKAKENPDIFGRTAAFPLPDFARSDAFRDFKAQLIPLKSGIFVNELTAMRDASKTGGAVGQVSDAEGARFENALGALEMSQSPKEFIKQLGIIQDSLTNWKAAMATRGADTTGGDDGFAENWSE